MIAGSQTETLARVSRQPLEDSSVKSEYIQTVKIQEDTTYQLIDNDEIGIYILEITATKGLQIYNITFE